MNGYKNSEIQRYLRNIGLAIMSVSAESVTIPAGAAGTIKNSQLEARPVLDSIGSDTGGLSDTSLVLTSTAFTTEVAPTTDALLTSGQYWVDYSTGKIRGMKADTSTSMTAAYKTLVVNSRERYQSGAEDNTNGTLSIAPKPLAGVATYSWSLFTNFGANATLNVKATPGNVLSLFCQNINAAIRYIQLHNTATTPAGGAVPILSFAVPASSSLQIGKDILGELGDVFTVGIAFAFSTTAGTYTAATAADQNTLIHFK